LSCKTTTATGDVANILAKDGQPLIVHPGYVQMHMIEISICRPSYQPKVTYQRMQGVGTRVFKATPERGPIDRRAVNGRRSSLQMQVKDVVFRIDVPTFPRRESIQGIEKPAPYAAASKARIAQKCTRCWD
jgi:hypothetical protein